MKRTKRILTWVLVSVLVLIAFGSILIYSLTYHLDETLDVETSVVTTRDYIYLAAENPEAIIIYYPGGLVEENAYIPFGKLLNDVHMDVYILKMPLNLAFLGLNKGLDIIKDSQLPVYLMGHSLGGVAMSLVYQKNTQYIDGLIYLASYPSEDLSSVDIPVISVYGTQDDVLDIEAYVDAKSLLPSHTIYHVIAGGNHAYFGNYGLQKGDGEACITRLEQQSETIDAIITWMSLE